MIYPQRKYNLENHFAEFADVHDVVVTASHIAFSNENI